MTIENRPAFAGQWFLPGLPIGPNAAATLTASAGGGIDPLRPQPPSSSTVREQTRAAHRLRPGHRSPLDFAPPV